MMTYKYISVRGEGVKENTTYVRNFSVALMNYETNKREATGKVQPLSESRMKRI